MELFSFLNCFSYLCFFFSSKMLAESVLLCGIIIAISLTVSGDQGINPAVYK